MNNKYSFSSLVRSLLLHNSNAFKACAGKGYGAGTEPSAGELNLSLILRLQKYPSNELVSFSRLYFSQRFCLVNVTILASAVFPGVELFVTVIPSVSL